jgi:hypothetical protein
MPRKLFIGRTILWDTVSTMDADRMRLLPAALLVTLSLTACQSPQRVAPTAPQDGASPETAFVTGRDIRAQYRILQEMGVQRLGRGLVMTRGCAFDVHMVRDTPQSPPRRVYFMLGGEQMDYRGACTLGPPGTGEQPVSGQGMLPR